MNTLIDELLDKYVANYNLEVLGHRQSGQATVKSELLKAILEVIGDDDVVQWDSDAWFCNNCDWQPVDGSKTCLCKVKNQLRQELRTKYKALFGVEG